MKKINLNECGGSAPFSYGAVSFGCSPDLSPRTMRIIYGPSKTIKSHIKKDSEKTIKQLYSQDNFRHVASQITEAQIILKYAIENAEFGAKNVERIMKKIKNAQKKEIATKIMDVLNDRLPKLKQAYDILNDIDLVEIPITFEKGNKSFIV